MDRPRLIRWLRIAVSAVCLVVTVLLVVIWISSYRQNYYHLLTHRGGRVFIIASASGLLHTSYNLSHTVADRIYSPFYDPIDVSDEFTPVLGFSYVQISEGGWKLAIPYWSLVTLSATLAYVPWLPWWSTRFSLRTLLIVTAIVAAVLGVVVWMVR